MIMKPKKKIMKLLVGLASKLLTKLQKMKLYYFVTNITRSWYLIGSMNYDNK